MQRNAAFWYRGEDIFVLVQQIFSLKQFVLFRTVQNQTFYSRDSVFIISDTQEAFLLWSCCKSWKSAWIDERNSKINESCFEERHDRYRPLPPQRVCWVLRNCTFSACLVLFIPAHSCGGSIDESNGQRGRLLQLPRLLRHIIICFMPLFLFILYSHSIDVDEIKRGTYE